MGGHLTVVALIGSSGSGSVLLAGEGVLDFADDVRHSDSSVQDVEVKEL